MGITFTSIPLKRIMIVARIIPHCLKQYGMARILTPIMELANVMTELSVILSLDLLRCG